MVRRSVLAAFVGASLVAAGLAVQGCIIGSVSGGNDCNPNFPGECCQCPWPDDCPPYSKEWPKIPDWCKKYLDGGLDVGGDQFNFESDAMSFCASGTCVPPAPEAWKPVAFVMSWPELPPSCPEEAPILAFEGNPEPPARTCPVCACDAPEGSCNVPTTWTFSTEPCANPGAGVKTNFNAPAGWEGSCTNENAIAKDKLCGGVPCVRSITITPPEIEEKPCMPHADNTANLPVLKAWSDGERAPTGRACVSDKPLSGCGGQGCSSTNSKFGACILREGEHVCPDGWNGDRHVLYGKIEDSRECTPCGCDPPTGGTCQVLLKTFSEPSCSLANATGFANTGMVPSPCHDYMAGDPVAGKTAEITSYTKGSCVPTGGEVVGKLVLDQQVTVCCYSSVM